MTAEVEAALALREARAARAPIAPLDASCFADPLAAAYRIQRLNIEAELARGRTVIGRKIGLTSSAVQTQLGVDQPDVGVLLDDMAAAEQLPIPLGRLIQPRIEAEIAFVLAADVDEPDLPLGELRRRIDYVAAAAEIVDSAIADWRISIVDTVADNASCGLFVLGERRVSLSGFDTRLCGMVLSRDGQDLVFGAGAACLGDPLRAVQWLANTCIANGTPLCAGEVILSGALGPMVAVRPNDRFQIEIGGLGSVDVRFDAGREGAS